jgi:hypothetical protein
MQLWNPSPLPLFPDVGTNYLVWDSSTDAADYSHIVAFRPQQTAVTPENTRTIVLRLLCHMIVSRLPDEALGEASECLADMYLFYKAPPALPKPHDVMSYPAKMGEFVERPPIQLEDD